LIVSIDTILVDFVSFQSAFQSVISTVQSGCTGQVTIHICQLSTQDALSTVQLFHIATSQGLGVSIVSSIYFDLLS
jgi:hypothetical protein